MQQHMIVEIKKNLLYILDEIVCSRQYLNKHFQNSMNNYFLENYATLPSLKKRFETQSGRQVRKEIFEKYSAKSSSEYHPEGQLKCFLIMRGFIEEHIINQSLNEYRSALAAIFNAGDASPLKKGCAEWVSLQWRRLFALMVLHHTHYPDIQGVYELWFHIFEERLIARERQKKKKEEIVPRKGSKVPYIISISGEESEIVIKKEASQIMVTAAPLGYDFQSKLEDCQNEWEEPILQKKRRTEDTIVLLNNQNSNYSSQSNSPVGCPKNEGIFVKSEFKEEETQDNNNGYFQESQQQYINQLSSQQQQQQQQYNITKLQAPYNQEQLPSLRPSISCYQNEIQPHLSHSQQQLCKIEADTYGLSQSNQNFTPNLWEDNLRTQGRYDYQEDQIAYLHQEQPQEAVISTTVYQDQYHSQEFHVPLLTLTSKNSNSQPQEIYGEQPIFNSFSTYPDHSNYYESYQCPQQQQYLHYPNQPFQQQQQFRATQDLYYPYYPEQDFPSEQQQQQLNHTWKVYLPNNTHQKQFFADSASDVYAAIQHDAF